MIKSLAFLGGILLLNKLLDFNEIKTADGNKNVTLKLEKVSKKDIAIIGMSGKFPDAKNIEEFWTNLINGKDCIREFPSKRMKDVSPLLPNSFMPENPPQLCQAGYLDEIDNFDYEFFNLSPNEARLMDPNQRLFLQTAWNVIEEAGYGGKRIRGSKTGVYVGHSSDLKFEYHMYVNMADPDLYEHISLPGNVKSIIASRISYLLDLKGPSVVVDTACSSALVAVHLACQGIISGDCDMAIAGGVKINLMPIQKGMDDEIGIRSPGDRAKTFDDSSDGTGSGEGVIAIMLKPLSKAVADKDHIYAVIKGSAVNQDGSSIGLTAPNSAAQEEVILEAWKNAGIDPETISYIETHGTATKLGDPIEISGIERAFGKHTDKKNFCAIGSVKTNIGHLDNISGIAGLIKLVMALKQKEIPASIHFQRPNRKINFIDSPVYINDKLSKWETEGFPLRGGVNSFGLAGTNCHVVIEAYKEDEKKHENQTLPCAHVLTVSAQSREVLSELIIAYKKYIQEHIEVELKDICHTANSGRMHHSHRLAIVVETRDELKKTLESLENFNFDTYDQKNIHYGEFRIVSGNREIKSRHEISEDSRKESSRLANKLIQEISSARKNIVEILNELSTHYVKGADIDWDLFYEGQETKKQSLPTYPFKRTRCWIEPKPMKLVPKVMQVKEIDHPLIDRCVIKTFGQEIYTVAFNLEHWILNEHQVAGRCVMPGTAYLEMIRQIYSKHLVNSYLELENILFLSPFIVEPGENKELQIIISEKDGYCDFIIASQSLAGHKWNIHVEGRVLMVKRKSVPVQDIKLIMQNAAMREIPEDDGRKIIVDIGPHWTKIKKTMYYGQNSEYLAYFELLDEYESDLQKYYLHPPLMDRSINAANTLIGEGSYLPLSYKNITIYGPTPKEFYSYLKKKDKEKDNLETARFDIQLIDKNGIVFVEVKDYVIKRVREDEFKFRQLKENGSIFHEVVWKIDPSHAEERDLLEGDILVFKGKNKISGDLIGQLRGAGCSLIEVELGDAFSKDGKDRFIIKGEEKCYHQLLEELQGRRISRILHLSTLSDSGKIESTSALEEYQRLGIYSLFYLTRALIAKKFNKEIDLVVISNHVNEVTKSEKSINPHNAALFGFGKVVLQEYPHLKCRCIDIDDSLTLESIMPELKFGGDSYQVAYRDGIRYIDEFKIYNIAKDPATKLEIKDQGVYIVTGGIGGIGLEICKYLTNKNKAKIALINRSKMPDREKWDDVLAMGENQKFCRAIRTIREMENDGAQICCYSADVSKYAEMKDVIDEIKNRYGAINGVIHCAGVAGDGFIITKEEEAFNSVITPKMQGTWIMDKLTEDENMDFFVMFSSITSILGGQGQGDYTAANAYMDSFAAYRSKLGKRTIAINWPAWKETGMAVDYGVDESHNTLKAISTEIAMIAFHEVLVRPIHRVVVGEINHDVFAALEDQFPISIADDMQLMINEYASMIKKYGPSNEKSQVQDIVITGSDDEDIFSETKRKIAGIWAEILGLDLVNIYDNFNSLGGDSILATRLLRKLENEFPGMMDIADVFAYSTVNDMAEYIEGLIKMQNVQETVVGKTEEDELDALLEGLAKGEISISEAEKYY